MTCLHKARLEDRFISSLAFSDWNYTSPTTGTSFSLFRYDPILTLLSRNSFRSSRLHHSFRRHHPSPNLPRRVRLVDPLPRRRNRPSSSRQPSAHESRVGSVGSTASRLYSTWKGHDLESERRGRETRLGGRANGVAGKDGRLGRVFEAFWMCW